MIKVGIVGGTGYTGVELLRLLAQHPEVELMAITSRGEAGTPVADMFPSLRGKVSLKFVDPKDAALDGCDAVFFATPNGIAMQQARQLLDAGVRVIAVSNHGGRVLDSTPGVATVLPLIRKKVGKAVTLTADGGVRTGYDVLKMLALGADAVLLGRDIIRAAVGAGTLGVKLHLEHVHQTLIKAMFMTGTKNIKMADSRILFNQD